MAKKYVFSDHFVLFRLLSINHACTAGNAIPIKYFCINPVSRAGPFARKNFADCVKVNATLTTGVVVHLYGRSGHHTTTAASRKMINAQNGDGQLIGGVFEREDHAAG
jgi:hypothetical protein